MKNLKKLTAVLLALALVFSMAACGGKKGGDTPAPDPAPAPDNNETTEDDGLWFEYFKGQTWDEYSYEMGGEEFFPVIPGYIEFGDSADSPSLRLVWDSEGGTKEIHDCTLEHIDAPVLEDFDDYNEDSFELIADDFEEGSVFIAGQIDYSTILLIEQINTNGVSSIFHYFKRTYSDPQDVIFDYNLYGEWRLTTGEIEGYVWDAYEEGVDCTIDFYEDGAVDFYWGDTYGDPVSYSFDLEVSREPLWTGFPCSWTLNMVPRESDYEWFRAGMDGDYLVVMQYSASPNEGEYPSVCLLSFEQVQ